MAVSRPAPALSERIRKEYQAALDENVVHLRACSDENQIVREVAAKEAGPHLLLVDLEWELGDVSPDMIPGREFMTEYVPPYILGQAFLAGRICAAVSQSPLGARLGPADPARLPAAEECMRRMGLAEVEEAAALDPKIPRAHFVRGMLRQVQGRIRESGSELQR
jgi:hypothetical protein